MADPVVDELMFREWLRQRGIEAGFPVELPPESYLRMPQGEVQTGNVLEGMRPAEAAQPSIGNRGRQASARRAMSGRDPTLTPEEMASVERRSAISAENDTAVERGVGDVLLGQPMRAGMAIGKAYNDPSLATLTNAGVQSALAVPTMRGAKTALGIGGAGLSAAAASDALDSPAEASDRDRARAAREEARAAKEQAGAAREQANTEREKAAAERERVKGERELSEQRLREDREKTTRAADAAASQRAIAARDEILADRPKKFSETGTGKVFDELGMIAPAIPGGIAGGLAGAGSRAAGAGHAAVRANAIGWGGLAGGLAGNWPLAHELMVAKPYNPEKEAYKAGALEMPTSDPRKAEWASHADAQPDANPARTVAMKELLDIPMAIKRSAFPVAEGAVAGLAAVDLPGAVGRLIGRGTGSGPGNKGGQTTGQAAGGATPQNLPGAQPGTPQNRMPYKDLPPQVRQDVQSNYISERALTGNAPPVGRTAADIRGNLGGQGFDVPVTGARVSETNRVISEFVAKHGRLPTANEFAMVFNAKTLAIPAGAAAAPSIMDLYQGRQ